MVRIASRGGPGRPARPGARRLRRARRRPRLGALLPPGRADYVSCSPFRVPVARLEAGRAAALETARGQRQQVTRAPAATTPTRPRRWVAEPPKRAQAYQRRGPFERDRARVLHSSALRRLAAKTQVVEVGRGRLPAHQAHPLAGVRADRPGARRARSAVTPTWSTPPAWPTTSGTRRSGTTASRRWPTLAAGCGGFEGNAQSLRLLTRLEAKVPGAGPQPDPGHPGRHAQVPLAAPAAPGRPGGPVRRRSTARTPTTPRCSAGSGTARRPGGRAWRPRSWTGPTTSRTPCTTWRTACTAGLITLARAARPGRAEGRRPSSPPTVLRPRARSTSAELGEVFDDAARRCRAGRTRFDGGPAGPGRAEEPDQRADRAVLPGRAGGDAGSASPGGRAAHPVRRRPGGAPAAAAGVRAAQGRHRALRDEPRRAPRAAQARERELITELAAARAGRRAGHAGPGAAARLPDAADSDAARLRVVVDQVASLTDTSAIAWHGACACAGRSSLCRSNQLRKERPMPAEPSLRDRRRQPGRRQGRRDPARGGLRRARRPARQRDRAPVRAAAAVQGLPARQGRAKSASTCTSEGWYAEHDVDLRLGRDRDRDRPGRAGRSPWPTARPSATTGCCWPPARRRGGSSMPGADLDGVLYLRTVGDSERLAAALRGGGRVVIAGAGLDRPGDRRRGPRVRLRGHGGRAGARRAAPARRPRARRGVRRPAPRARREVPVRRGRSASCAARAAGSTAVITSAGAPSCPRTWW